jgi:hypothetical protein
MWLVYKHDLRRCARTKHERVELGVGKNVRVEAIVVVQLRRNDAVGRLEDTRLTRAASHSGKSPVYRAAGSGLCAGRHAPCARACMRACECPVRQARRVGEPTRAGDSHEQCDSTHLIHFVKLALFLALGPCYIRRDLLQRHRTGWATPSRTPVSMRATHFDEQRATVMRRRSVHSSIRGTQLR